VYLLEQGNIGKAGLNVSISVIACLVAVWLGLFLGRYLFVFSGQGFVWSGGLVPYGLLLVNLIGAILIGFIGSVLYLKVPLSMEHSAALAIILIGGYITMSGLYVVFYMIEQGYAFESHLSVMLSVFTGNSFLCLLVIWFGMMLGRQV
jgi:CrcB protein